MNTLPPGVLKAGPAASDSPSNSKIAIASTSPSSLSHPPPGSKDSHPPGLGASVLKFLVIVASSGWTKAALALVWLLSLCLVLHRGWAWERSGVLDQGTFFERYRSFVIERTPLFVWFSMILLAYAAHRFRQRSLGYYGLVEIVFGLTGGIVSIGKLPLDQATTWLALTGSTFVIVRGSANIAQAVSDPHPKLSNSDPKS